MPLSFARRSMSDDDRDIDIESDENEEVVENEIRPQRTINGAQYLSQAEKRAHHNALERKRRDHIKDSFSCLRDSVPALHNEKVASRAQILKKAAEYIQYMKKKNMIQQQDIEDLKRQNALLDAQIRTLEKAKARGNLVAAAANLAAGNARRPSESDSTDHENRNGRRTKRIRISLNP